MKQKTFKMPERSQHREEQIMATSLEVGGDLNETIEVQSCESPNPCLFTNEKEEKSIKK